MLQKIKDWALMVLLALVAVLGIILTGRKPQWVKKKEEEVEKRNKALKKAKKQEEKAENYYEELKVINDKEIEEIKNMPGREDFTSASDAADYINSILNRRRR